MLSLKVYNLNNLLCTFLSLYLRCSLENTVQRPTFFFFFFFTQSGRRQSFVNFNCFCLTILLCLCIRHNGLVISAHARTHSLPEAKQFTSCAGQFKHSFRRFCFSSSLRFSLCLLFPSYSVTFFLYSLSFSLFLTLCFSLSFNAYRTLTNRFADRYHYSSGSTLLIAGQLSEWRVREGALLAFPHSVFLKLASNFFINLPSSY